MVVCLSYAKEDSPVSSLWEYFFKSCGIWVDKKELADDLEMLYETSSLELTILDSKKGNKCAYLYAGVSGHAYLLSDANDNTSGHNNNILSWKRPDYEKQVIQCLFGRSSEYEDIKKLWSIFQSSGLWRTGWIYEEFAKDNGTLWDKEIVKSCDTAIEAIKNQFSQKSDSSVYAQYMKFYCQYMRCGTKHRFLDQRLKKSEELLWEYIPYASRHKNNIMYQYLAGRISELNYVENKQAVYYYERAAALHGHSCFLYDIGHSYEKVYGDNDYALHFYKKAYKKDKKNYRALYKLAGSKEVEGKWIESFNFYGKIADNLYEITEYNYKNTNSVSVGEIDYLYKAYNRMYYICKYMLGLGDMAEHYKRMKQDIKDRLVTGRSFEKIVTLMTNNKKDGEEIAEELEKRFEGKCYQLYK